MLAVGAVQLLILLVGLARAKFLSFAIGTEGYGIVGTVDQIIVTMVSTGSLGLPFVAIKILSRHQSESQEQFERAYAGFFAALATLGIVTAATGVLLALFAPGIFGAGVGEYRLLIAVAALAVPSLMVNILLANALASSRFGKRAALFTLLVQAVLLAATIVGELLGGLEGIYIATVLGGSLLTLGAVIKLRSTLGSPFTAGFSWLSSEIRRERTLVVYAFWSYAATAIYALSLSGLRTSVFSNAGAASAGILAAAMNLALTVGAVVNPISNLLLTPYLNRTLPFGEKVSAANDYATKMLTVVLVISLPMVLFPRLVMTLLFAPDFLPAASVLFAFVVWQCLAQTVNVLTQLLVGLDDFAFACAATILGNGAVFALSAWATARLGISGAAILLIAGAVLCGAVSAMRLRAKFGSMLGLGATVRFAFALATIGASWLLTSNLAERSLAGVAARAGYAILAVMSMFALLAPAERAWIKEFVRIR